jgi:hypothetical protein
VLIVSIVCCETFNADIGVRNFGSSRGDDCILRGINLIERDYLRLKRAILLVGTGVVSSNASICACR